MFVDSGQQKGILGLILIILVLAGVIYGMKKSIPKSARDIEVVEMEQQMQYFLDSLKQIASDKANEALQIKPFNPNFLTDYRGYVLGMSVEEIDRMLTYRKTDQWVNSPEEFQTVTKVSDSLLMRITPYFKFPEWVSESKNKEVSGIPKTKKITGRGLVKGDLNTATANDLIAIGLKPEVADRIIHYRVRLGRFLGESQLKDVYGLTPKMRENVLEQFEVLPDNSHQKISLNSATIAELTEIPYFDYELSRKIIAYRTMHKKINDLEELLSIDGFPKYKIEQLHLYLSLE